MKKQITLRSLLLGGIATFVIIILTALWLCQVVFLDELYHLIKKQEIKTAAKNVSELIEKDTLSDSALLSVGEKYEVCIEVYTVSGMPRRIATADVVPRCALHSTDPQSKLTIYDAAVKNGGVYLEYFEFDPKGRVYRSVGDRVSELEDQDLSMIYAVLTERNGQPLMMIFNSSVTPISATVSTLYVLLSIFTVLILLLSVIFANVFSRTIAKPIDKLTDKADMLARGAKNTDFSVTGYTEIEKLSDALGYASDEIQKTEELRRDFLANVTHDLKTPITLIAGYSEMMLDFPEENTPDNLRNIVNETERLSFLVNEVLDYSKLVSGTVAFEKTEYCLTDQVKEITERYAEMLKKDGFSLTYEGDASIYVHEDASQIARVLINYITNAVSHTGEGEKSVKVTQTAENGWVTVSVTDNGGGIPKELLPGIWERYYKVGKNNTRTGAGSGLGLSIVKAIMDRCGGAYGVKSTVGKGSTFWFALPISHE